jgi:MFS family permease
MGRGTSLVSAFAVREFRAMWAAEALSQAGDQIARVALSVLVYEQTASAGLTGLTYGLTYLPTLIGGTFLARLGDRYPRRTVMIVCDVLRALVAALMALPGMPLFWLCALLVVLTVAGGPFRAAQLALLPTVLTPRDRYLAGLAIRNITIQSAQVAGFGGGGLVIAVVGTSWGLGINALTFAVSAAFVWLGVRSRPATANSAAPRGWWSRWFGDGAHAMRATAGVGTLFALKMLAGIHVMPEGLAAPYADQLAAGTAAVGLILASDPIGSVVGAWVYARWAPQRHRPALVGWLAVGAGVPLVFLFSSPALPVSMALVALSGTLSTPYHMQATAMITLAVPDDVRAQVSGLTSTALVTVQGVGIVLAGVVARWHRPQGPRTPLVWQVWSASSSPWPARWRGRGGVTTRDGSPECQHFQSSLPRMAFPPSAGHPPRNRPLALNHPSRTGCNPSSPRARAG